MALQVCRWLPKRLLVVVADSSFAVIDLLWQLRQLKNPICMITRFRLDAALYERKINLLAGNVSWCKNGTVRKTRHRNHIQNCRLVSQRKAAIANSLGACA
jgi:hypothetical protein